MTLQSIWWCDILKDPLFEPLQAKFQPERTHSSHLVVIWSRLSQSVQNTHWRRQWLPHLTRISFHRAKFLSLGRERSHTEPNPENRVDEESIHSRIRSFVIATVDLWDGALSWWKSTFLRANLASNDYQMNYASFLAEIWPEGVRRVDLSRCRVIKWIVAPFHENLPNLSNDPRIKLYRRSFILSDIWSIISRIDNFIEKFFERKLHGLKRDTLWKCGLDLEWPCQNQVNIINVFLNGNPYFLLHIVVAYLKSFPKHYNKIIFR